MPGVMRNLGGLDLRQCAFKRGKIGQSDQNHVGDFFWIGTIQGRKMVSGMVGLNDLMFGGQICADENVNVLFVVRNLCHGKNLRLNVYGVKRKIGELTSRPPPNLVVVHASKPLGTIYTPKVFICSAASIQPESRRQRRGSRDG